MKLKLVFRMAVFLTAINCGAALAQSVPADKVADSLRRDSIKRGSTMDEVQIIGYGKTSRRFTTGNTATLKAAEIAKQPVNNPLLALSGRIPGLVISQSTGLPGTGVTVQVQGQNSISNTVGSDPLYVIDGVPYPGRLLWSMRTVLGNSGDKSALSSDGLAAGAGNPLSFINSNDIESIDVLKDADATAIFGSRAANGAILISTKKGVAGKTKVDFNLQRGYGSVAEMPDLLGSRQYLEMRHEALKNNSYPVVDFDYDLNGTWDTTRYTNWQKELIGNTAGITDAQGAFSGGSESTQFYFGGAYRKENTVFPGDLNDQRGSARFNMNHASANQRFKLQLSAAYMADHNQLIDVDLTKIALRLAPLAPNVYKADGSLNWAPAPNNQSTWINPMSYLERSYTLRSKNLTSSSLLRYSLLSGLDLQANLGYNNLRTDESAVVPLNAIAPEKRTLIPRSASYNYGRIESWLLEPQVNYKKEIGKSWFEILAGATMQQNNSSLETQYGTGYANDLLLSNISAAQIVTLVKGSSAYKYSALFGRISYNLADKYLLNLTARRDGSSRFGVNNQFQNFAAAGFGWIFSKEEFLAENLSFLSFGKIKGSYGTTGNDQIGDYQYLSLYKNLLDANGLPIAYQPGGTGLNPNNLANPYLQWEETHKFSTGINLGFLKDRILIEANYYRNRSSNQLLAAPLAAFTGYNIINGAFQQNFKDAVVLNYGWEFMLNTVNLAGKHFSWSTNLNLSIPKNKLLSLPEEAAIFATQLTVGQPITSGKRFHSLGVDPQTGLYMVADKDGNPTATPNLATDATTVVNPGIRYYGGLQNSFRYKGVELDILLQYVRQTGKKSLFEATPAGNFTGGPDEDNVGNQLDEVMNRWEKPGDITGIPKFDNTLSSASWSNARLSDAAYGDASYLRLKNVSLSWGLPDNWSKSIGLAKTRVYLQGQNLFTVTRYDGLDPERVNWSGTYQSLPALRVIAAGLQVVLQ